MNIRFNSLKTSVHFLSLALIPSFAFSGTSPVYDGPTLLLPDKSALYGDYKKSLRLSNLDQISSEERRTMIIDGLTFAFGPINNVDIVSFPITNFYESTLETLTRQPLFRSYEVRFTTFNYLNLNSIHVCNIELGSKLFMVDYCKIYEKKTKKLLEEITFERPHNPYSILYSLSSFELLKRVRNRVGSNKKPISVLIDSVTENSNNADDQKEVQSKAQR